MPPWVAAAHIMLNGCCSFWLNFIESIGQSAVVIQQPTFVISKLKSFRLLCADQVIRSTRTVDKVWIINIKSNSWIYDHLLQILKLKNVFVQLIDADTFSFENLTAMIRLESLAFRPAAGEVRNILVRSKFTLEIAQVEAGGQFRLTWTLNSNDRVGV